MKVPAILFLLIISALSASAFSLDDAQAEAALDRLDKVLEGRQAYIDRRQQHIDSLCAALAQQPDSSLALISRIADAYQGFNNDSALYYLNRGYAEASGAESLPFRWQAAALLPLGGFFDTAMELYDKIPADSVPAEQLVSYYDSGRQMYSYMAAFFRQYPDVAGPYQQKALEMQARMLEALPTESDSYKFNRAEYYFLSGEVNHARILLEELLDRPATADNIRARAAHHLSSIAKVNGEESAYIYFLTLSAIADVRSATREVASLQELGATIYEQGEVARSHRYLSHAMANAVECGAPLRMIETSLTLPIIERAHSDRIDAWRKTIYWIMGAMAILMLVLITTLLVLRHEMHKMTKLQAKLRSANTAKEIYISQFLQLCSIYMDKLNQFCKIATRKLAAGQSDELYRMTKSGKFVEEQSREFYEVFDNAFLHIYPNFIEEVNSLLRPDAQIVLNEGEMLNTDLRILAFMRLGIEESARIAQILNYSLNTIYSYRNRLKARAINRDTFETDILNINSEN